MRKSLLFLIIFLFSLILTGQNPQNPEPNNPPVGGFGFRWQSAGFFWNKEFFSKITQGYTLPGFWAEPSLEFTGPDGRITLQAGAHVSRLFGDRKGTDIQPLFRITRRSVWKQRNPGNEALLEISIGRLGPFTEVPDEILFRHDREFSEAYRNGLEILFRNRMWDTQSQVNWVEYINPGDTTQEFFWVSQWLQYRKTLDGNWFNEFRVPFRAFITHRGGQINSQLPLQTLANLSIGLELKAGNLRWSPGLKTNLYWFEDLSPNSQFAFSRGYAWNLAAGIQPRPLRLWLEYIQCHHFLSPLGEQLFQSFSDHRDFYSLPDRRLLNLGLHFEPGPSGFSFKAKAFYDLEGQKLDYYWGLSWFYQFRQEIKGP